MEIQQKHIPQLRFPGFKNDGNWEVAKVGDVIKTITPPKKLNSSEYKKFGKYPIIDQSQSFICGYSDDEDALMNHNNEDLIVFGDHTCILKFVSFPFIQGADGIKIIKSKDPNKLVESFLFQSLLNNPVVSREYKRHFSELKEKEFCFPHRIAEQQKTAFCLFSIDAYISTTKEKLELLKTYKKGLMQKLFPAKGKKLPELRFKEFEKDGEWEEKKLGEIVNVLDSQRKPVAKNERMRGKYPYYGANGIQDYVSDYIFDGSFLLMGEDGSVINKDGTPVLHWAEGRIWVNNHAHVMSENCNAAYLKYVFYVLSKVDVQSLVKGIPPKINQQNMRNILLLIPSLPEQEKIASCLSTLDEKINSYKEKIALLGQYKKGLMQQLFPTSK